MLIGRVDKDLQEATPVSIPVSIRIWRFLPFQARE
jgi:hypothetical protein